MWAEIGYICFGVWLWEYIGIRIRSQLKYKFISPTTIINCITYYAKIFFDRIGWFLAFISSFYIYLRLEDFGKAGWDLLVSTWKLICSIFEVFQGYIKIASTFKRSYLVYIGTAIIIGVVFFNFYYFEVFELENPINSYMTLYLIAIGVFPGLGLIITELLKWSEQFAIKIDSKENIKVTDNKVTRNKVA